MSTNPPTDSSPTLNHPRTARQRFVIRHFPTVTTVLILLALSLLAARPARAQSDDIVPANVQSSIDRGLEWLAAHQQRDGSYPSSEGANSAVTSLATMAFLARGHLPGQGPYGDRINRGIDWVLKQQHDGLIAAGDSGRAMYEHGISTVMLCEAYGMVDEQRQQRIQTVVAGAIRLILDAQRVPKGGNETGGWRYTPTMPSSDISVSGWQLMALRGAANIGAAVPDRALRDGAKYITGLSSPSGGFGYTSPGPVSPARTGTGVLSLELLGHHDSKETISGGDYLLRNPLRSDHIEFYYYAVYYVSQAANQLGGKHWPGIYKPLRDTLVANQRRDGSWNSDGQQGGDICATSMALLGLCVPYRYLPLYQR